MKLRKLFSTVIVSLALICGASFQARAESAGEALTKASVLETIKKRGVMRVGISTFVPWAFRDKTGEFVGFEVDIAKKIAEDMGLDVEFVPTSFSGIIPALLAGKFDVIITGISIQTKRAMTINYSNPYAQSGQALTANKKLAEGFTTLADFNKPDVVISTRRGTVGAKTAKALFPKAEHRFFDEDIQAFQEVMNGKAHAFVALEPMPTLWALAHADVLFKPLGDQRLTNQLSGFAVRRGDPDILAFLNSWIHMRQADNWLNQRHKFWFGTNEWYELLEVPPVQ
ncbi:MAG: transporter substrate-binding domain-containing protein [SAR202 cluster bacterium]|mgnify:FL=1|nr:transporter substrate-binding domain-containing protein [SAR202 cluster bacterium]|tara:strand:- start:9035 stop:9886 length:852 start_codon:yes stop_codon:yes gene_type:complete